MPAKVLAVVEDIFFLAKIQQTARQLGVTVEAVTPDALQGRVASNGASAILLDLNHRSGKAIAALESIKNDPATRHVPVVAFLSHVQTDLAQSARTAGCDRVLARSTFSQQLPRLLLELSKEENPILD
jgi:CheY-like chemotaxis protein